MVQELEGRKRLRDSNGFRLMCMTKSLRSNELSKEEIRDRRELRGTRRAGYP